ncbi:sulfotransferase family protein [Candidatus Woesearchaeota archaeon]|nr:sulfotransferase family protein [Candidatus Woesearchaeota archaeon]
MGFGVSEILVIMAAIMFLFGGKQFVGWIVKFKEARDEVLSQINPLFKTNPLKNKKLFFVPIHFNAVQEIKNLNYTILIPFKKLKEEGLPENKTSFAVVSNPWERLVRRYNDIENPHVSFDKYVDCLGRGGEFLRFDQTYFISNDKGEIIVDEIIKYENLKQDLKKLCEKEGIMSIDRLKGNFEPVKDYQKYYNEETKKKVEEFYKRDIELFGYTFDDNIKNKNND